MIDKKFTKVLVKTHKEEKLYSTSDKEILELKKQISELSERGIKFKVYGGTIYNADEDNLIEIDKEDI